MRNSSKPRIVWLLTHPIQYFVNLIDELHRRGNVEVVAIFANGGSDFHDRSFGQNVDWNSRPDASYPFVVLPDSNARGFKGPLSTRSRYLAKELDRLKPDVVHINSYNNAMQWQGYLWARRNQVPHFFRGDGDMVAQRTSVFRPIRKALFRPIVAGAATVFTQGRQNSLFMLDAGAHEEQLTWIPCVSDSNRFRKPAFTNSAERSKFRLQQGANPSDCVFVFCGKLISRKRAADLLDGLERIPDVSAKLWFLGSGPEAAQLKAKTEAKGLSDRVNWLGFQDQAAIPSFLQAADVFVHPSQWDPWPYAVLDAATCGLPLLLSDRTGCHADWMAEPPAGLGFPCGDLEALSQAMELFSKDSALRHTAGSNAATQAARHTESVFCEIFEQAIFSQCCCHN